MRWLKYLISGLFFALLTHGSAFAQTATATTTVTATPSSTAVAPTPAATPSPNGTVYSGLTNFGYLGTVPKSNGIYGGYIVQLKSTNATLYGQVVIPDSANANSVVVAPTTSPTNPIGVIVGCVGATSANPQPGVKFGCNPAALQTALILVHGVAAVVCDTTLPIGTVMMPSTFVAGDVTKYSAGTVDEQIGVLLSACTTNGSAPMLVYK
jgi:hypothetical protein